MRFFRVLLYYFFAAIVLAVSLCLASCAGTAQNAQSTQATASLPFANGSSAHTNDLTAGRHVHSFGEWIVVTPPFCESEGLRERFCSCGERETEGVPATGHTEVYVYRAIEPTCTQEGSTEGRVCALCGKVLVESEIIPPTGHSFSAWRVTASAGCESVGVRERFCACGQSESEILPPTGHAFCDWVIVTPVDCESDGLCERSCACGKRESAVMPAPGHTVVIDGAVAVSCTKSGLTEGSHCLTCGEVFVAQERIRATGHAPTVLPAVESTCTEAGLASGRICVNCGLIMEQQARRAPLGHDYITETVLTAPTCTEAGSGTAICARCGVHETRMIPASGHTVVIDEGIAPTCTSGGKTEGSHCSVCGLVLVEQERLHATGHAPTALPAVAPTCTEAGLTAGQICANCGLVMQAQVTRAPLGHIFTGYTVTRQPTCAQEGLETTVCTRCGASEERALAKTDHRVVTDAAVAPTCTLSGKTEGSHCSFCGLVVTPQQIIPAKGHVLQTIAGKAPKCTALGQSDGEYCTVCGEVLKEKETLPALGHHVVDGVCTNCGRRMDAGNTTAFDLVAFYIRLAGKNTNGVYRSVRGTVNVDGLPYEYSWGYSSKEDCITLTLSRSSGGNTRSFSVRIDRKMTYLTWNYEDRTSGRTVRLAGQLDFVNFNPEIERLPYITAVGTAAEIAQAERDALALARALWHCADEDAGKIGLSLRDLG